jgi:hypothetical protein
MADLFSSLHMQGFVAMGRLLSVSRYPLDLDLSGMHAIKSKERSCLNAYRESL